MIKILLINVIIVIFIFVFIEIFIRITTNITPQGLSKGIINTSIDPVFNYPNVKGKKVFGQKVFTDNSGYRIQKKNNKEMNSPIIYFIGGSVTFGSGVKQKETFSGILNQKFSNYNIINSSVIGSNLINNFKILNKTEKKEMKKVFINFSLDDLVGLDQLIEEETNKKSQKSLDNFGEKKPNFISKLKENKIFVKINKFVRSKSVTYVWVKGKFLNSQKSYYDHAIASYKNEKNLKGLESILSKISNLNSKEFNNKIHFLVIPYSYQINNKNCKRKDYAENMIDKYFSKAKVELIKLKEFFCSEEKKEKIYLKFDPSHLSPYGHKIVANFLERKIN